MSYAYRTATGTARTNRWYIFTKYTSRHYSQIQIFWLFSAVIEISCCYDRVTDSKRVLISVIRMIEWLLWWFRRSSAIAKDPVDSRNKSFHIIIFPWINRYFFYNTLSVYHYYLLSWVQWSNQSWSISCSIYKLANHIIHLFSIIHYLIAITISLVYSILRLDYWYPELRQLNW